jgi:hypothetical protein
MVDPLGMFAMLNGANLASNEQDFLGATILPEQVSAVIMKDALAVTQAI